VRWGISRFCATNNSPPDPNIDNGRIPNESYTSVNQ
jgi:hypothetical protein